MSLEDFASHDTVRVLADGDVILVGEDHSSRASAQLMDDVIDTVEPETLAIEMRRATSHAGSGMGRARSRFEAGDAERIAAIDDGYHYTVTPSAGETDGIMQTANRFSHPVEDDGDMDPAARDNARQNVYDEYGWIAYCRMYLIRELQMAKRLRQLREQSNGAVVAGIGAFHLDHVEKAFNEYETQRSPLDVAQ